MYTGPKFSLKWMTGCLFVRYEIWNNKWHTHVTHTPTTCMRITFQIHQPPSYTQCIMHVWTPYTTHVTSTCMFTPHHTCCKMVCGHTPQNIHQTHICAYHKHANHMREHTTSHTPVMCMWYYTHGNHNTSSYNTPPTCVLIILYTHINHVCMHHTSDLNQHSIPG